MLTGIGIGTSFVYGSGLYEYKISQVDLKSGKTVYAPLNSVLPCDIITGTDPNQDCLYRFKFLPGDNLFESGVSKIKNYGTGGDVVTVNKYTQIEESTALPDLTLTGTPTKQDKYVVTVTTAGNETVAQVKITRGANPQSIAYAVNSPFVYDGITFTFAAGTFTLNATYTFYTCNLLNHYMVFSSVADTTNYALDNTKGMCVSEKYLLRTGSQGISAVNTSFHFPSTVIDYASSAWSCFFKFTESDSFLNLTAYLRYNSSQYNNDIAETTQENKYPIILGLGPITATTYTLKIERTSSTHVSINGTSVAIAYQPFSPVVLYLEATATHISVYFDSVLVATVAKNAGTVNTALDNVIFCPTPSTYKNDLGSSGSVFFDFGLIGRALTDAEKDFVTSITQKTTDIPAMIFSGQSNAVGQLTAPTYSALLDDISVYGGFHDSQQWVRIANDLSKPRASEEGYTAGAIITDYPGSRAAGPEITALVEHTANSGLRGAYFVIKIALVGTAIQYFFSASGTSRSIYPGIIKGFFDIGAHCKVKLLSFIQGESDADSVIACPLWWVRLRDWVNRIKNSKIGDSNMKTIVPKLQNIYANGTTTPGYAYRLNVTSPPYDEVETMSGLRSSGTQYQIKFCKQNGQSYLYDSASVTTNQVALLSGFTVPANGTYIDVNCADTTAISALIPGYFLVDSDQGRVLTRIQSYVANTSVSITRWADQTATIAPGAILTNPVCYGSALSSPVMQPASGGGRWVYNGVATFNHLLQKHAVGGTSPYSDIDVYMLPTDDIGLGGDNVHYTEATCQTLGTRLGQKIVDLGL